MAGALCTESVLMPVTCIHIVGGESSWCGFACAQFLNNLGQRERNLSIFLNRLEILCSWDVTRENSTAACHRFFLC